MLYIGTTENDKTSLRAAAHRGKLKQLARGIYTDEHEADPDQLIRDNVLAIAGTLLPDWHLSYSSAALLDQNRGLLFVSSTSTTHSPIVLPGLKIIRGQDLTRPEVDRVESPTMIASSLRSEPKAVRLQVSSALQTVFECLAASARSYEERTLPESKLIELIESLSQTDRERAKAFAARNDMQVEYYRFLELLEQARTVSPMRVGRRREFTLFFYGWEVGVLSVVSDEFRFSYGPKWQVKLSDELPLNLKPSFENRRMPTFFDNMLPEGWTEAQLQSTFKIAREDKLGLLATSQKYLSNLTIRPADFDPNDMVFDTLNHQLTELAPAPDTVLKVEDRILEHQSLWHALRGVGAQGPMRVSGVQAKLPVELAVRDGQPVLNLGVLGNSCSHIIKYQSPTFPNMVENEWATMELASRAGLHTAVVRMVQKDRKGKSEGNLFDGPALLIERYDIPTRSELHSAQQVALQEDAASLLMLNRSEKYDASAERIAKALMQLELPNKDMQQFLEHLIFSVFIANGDLHAKNVSVIKWLTPGQFGLYPTLDRVAYSPIYDLVNTRIYLPRDQFAMTINGRNENIKAKDLAAIATRWGMTKAHVVETMENLADNIQRNIDEVLEQSGLPKDKADAYRAAVEANIKSTL